MEAWVSRPLDAPDVPGAVLEAHANDLRESRERLRRLLQEQGVRDDIEAALAAYEKLRQPRAREAVLGSRARAHDNHLTSPLARLRRDLRYAWRKRFGGDQTVFQAGRLYDYDAGRELA